MSYVMFTNHTFKCAVITQFAPRVVPERQSAAKARKYFSCEFLSSVRTNGTPLHDNMSRQHWVSWLRTVEIRVFNEALPGSCIFQQSYCVDLLPVNYLQPSLHQFTLPAN